MVQQLVNATAGYGDINLLIRTDQEPALKQIARTWQSSRAAMKLKSSIQLVAVGQHQGLLSERYIQTVRRQTLCLMHELEARTGVTVAPGSILCTWALRHAGWLLNRFQPASGQGGQTPFELRFERRYAGKLVPFGTTVFARTLPGKPKGIAQFEKAIFLGKSEASDSFLVGTISGTRVARTVRRSVTPYQAESLMKVKGVPWNFQQESVGVKLRYQRTMPTLGTVPFVDEKAEAVKKAAQEQISSEEEPPDDILLKELEEQNRQEVPKTPSNPPTPPRTPAGELRAPMVDDRAQGTKRPAEEQLEPPAQAGSTMDTEESRKRGLESTTGQIEGSPSRARTSAEGSPTGQQVLYPPSFAGNVSRVVEVQEMLVATLQESGDQYLFGADDEEEECNRDYGEDKDQLISQFWDDADVENAPVVSSGELAMLDEAAFQQEVTRLQEMKVLRKVKRHDLASDFKELSTTAVQDWRHRGGSWQRRSRLVAREYRWSDPTRQDLFAASTASSQTKLLAGLAVCNPQFQLWSIDVKDAFLQVPQKAKVFVKPPKGYEHLLKEDEVWVLDRLLPGQRAGTKEWSLFLKEVVEKEGYETFQLSPNLYVKKSEKGDVEGAILVHVDDIQLAATPTEGQRLKAKLEEKFSLTTQGPCGPGGTEESVHFLKRRYEYDENGFTIKMGAKYIEKLVQLLGLQGKKARATPELADANGNAKELVGTRRSNYATAVGILLYISPDRPDAQHCIRELASHLVRPTESQYRQLEHLTCYLKGTAGYAVRLPKTTRGQSVLQPQLEEDQQSEEHLLEVFTDSDWGGNKTTRKSVSVAHMYWNGTLIHTLTRTQKAVALSSCEAEYVAMTTGTSEGVFLKNCIEFLTGKRCRIMLRCDLSSARAFCYRQGVGRVRHISCGLLWLQDLVQQGDLDVKPVNTWRNTADLSTKVQAKRRIQVLLNLMGFVDTHNDYTPVGETERLEDEQKALERKAVRRMQKGNLQTMYKMFRVLMVQSLLEEATASPVQGLEPQDTEPLSCGSIPRTGAGDNPFWIPLLMGLITVLAIGILLIKRICRRRSQGQAAIQERVEDAERAIQTVWDEAIAHGERLDRLEARSARLQEQSAIAEEHLQQLRSEVRTLRVAIQRLTQENSGPVMVVQTDVPGLRESIIRQAQERGIELSVQEEPEEGISEPSDQGSDWDREEEAFGDNAQWMQEYRSILAYERDHGPLVSPTGPAVAAPRYEEEEATEDLRELQPEEEPMRAGD